MLRHVLIAIATVIGVTPSARAAPAATGTAAVNPQCGCCQGHASYLRANGFTITVKETRDMSLIRRQHGVPDKPEGCQVLLDGYVVEGHVPAAPIRKLHGERHQIKGISLPGMPDGSPGITGRKSEPFKIYEISEGDLEGYLQLNTPVPPVLPVQLQARRQN